MTCLCKKYVFIIYYFTLSGFPNVPVLALPIEEIWPMLLLELIAFLLPILISCFIYLKLISIKNKLFQNTIEIDNRQHDSSGFIQRQTNSTNSPNVFALNRLQDNHQRTPYLVDVVYANGELNSSVFQYYIKETCYCR